MSRTSDAQNGLYSIFSYTLRMNKPRRVLFKLGIKHTHYMLNRRHSGAKDSRRPLTANLVAL